ETLRPVLKTMDVDACVFGVTGNSPVDYLATLSYVQKRIEDDARIAIYIYVYNDFVSMTKYVERALRGSSPVFETVAELVNYYDQWRRATLVQGTLRKATARAKEAAFLRQLESGIWTEIEVDGPYKKTSESNLLPSLIPEERAAFRFFLQRLRELVGNRPW